MFKLKLNYKPQVSGFTAKFWTLCDVIPMVYRGTDHGKIRPICFHTENFLAGLKSWVQLCVRNSSKDHVSPESRRVPRKLSFQNLTVSVYKKRPDSFLNSAEVVLRFISSFWWSVLSSSTAVNEWARENSLSYRKIQAPTFELSNYRMSLPWKFDWGFSSWNRISKSV